MTPRVPFQPGAQRDGRAAAQVIVAVANDAARGYLVGHLKAQGYKLSECANADELLALASDLRPEAVLVGDSLPPSGGTEALRKITEALPGVSCLLLKGEPEPADYRRALQAGARDLLEFPLEPEALLLAVQSAAESSQNLRRALEQGLAPDATTARRIAVFSTKGGTGKTFVATNLAVALASAGKPTALVDLDLQFGDAALALGLTPERTVFDLVRLYTEYDLPLMQDFLLKHPSGLHLLPAPLFPDQSEQVTVDEVRTILSVIETGYEFVIVDGPPFFEERMIAALDWADDILHIGSMDAPSLKNMKLSLKTMELMGFSDNRMHLVMNRADSKVGLTLDDAHTHLNARIEFAIPSCVDVPRSINAGEALILKDPASRASLELSRIARYFSPAQVEERNDKGRRFSFFRKQGRHDGSQ
jgi:pilus assembly protein CpaE